MVAVEAHPELAEIASEQLFPVQAAISPDGQPAELNLCTDNPGGGSLYGDWMNQSREGAITVSGVTMHQLFEQYGTPEYRKVDIEGADRLCVLALTQDTRPSYLPFEAGDDADELLSHAEAIGY